MTITKVIKALYVKLGGSLTDTYSGIADGAPIADYTVISDCIKALYVLYGGDLSEVYSGISDVAVKDYTTSAKAIAALAKVISKGITPTGKITITENGENIDVAQYATADVGVRTYSGDLKSLIERYNMGDIPEDIGLTTIGAYAYAKAPYSSSSTLVCPATINAIHEYGFYGATMGKIVLEDISAIDDYAFKDCINLEKVYIMTNSISQIGTDAFDGCTSLTDIYYAGTQLEWENITGLSDAGVPQTCTVHYEYTPE